MENTAKTGEHKCKNCPQTFTRKADLKRHSITIHDKVKPHQCGICSKRFARKQHKELHLRTCSLTTSTGIPSTKKSNKPMFSLKFHPRLRKSAFGGIVTEWSIGFPTDYRLCDLKTLLVTAATAMKDTIMRQLHEKTKKLKFTMSIHIVFEKAAEPEIQTVPAVVLTSDPRIVYLGTDIDASIIQVAEELLEMIETYEGCGSGWVYNYLERLDTSIFSF